MPSLATSAHPLILFRTCSRRSGSPPSRLFTAGQPGERRIGSRRAGQFPPLARGPASASEPLAGSSCLRVPAVCGPPAHREIVRVPRRKGIPPLWGYWCRPGASPSISGNVPSHRQAVRLQDVIHARDPQPQSQGGSRVLSARPAHRSCPRRAHPIKRELIVPWDKGQSCPAG